MQNLKKLSEIIMTYFFVCGSQRAGTTLLFLIMVQDPRDTIASMIEVGERLLQQGYQDIFTTMFTTHDMKQLCNHYKSFYTPSIHYQVPDFQNQLLYI
jgi:hypothetical protein